MKNNVYLFVCVCILLIAVIIRSHLSARHEPPDLVTREGLSVVADAIELYQAQKTNFPPALTSSNDMTLYQSLAGTNDTRYLAENPRWDKSGKVIDQWGNEYRAEASVKTNTDGSQFYQLIVWSCGPNGNDQHGEDDNIKIVRRWPKHPPP
jgi:hypothetical protein